MSLEPRADHGVPELTARVVRAAFPKGTLAVRIREALGPLFEDEAFAGAFAVRGRPIRAFEFRTYRRHRQSAEPEVKALGGHHRRTSGEPG